MEKEKYITEEEITLKMLELQEKINYEFNNIQHLKNAMNATLMSKTNEEKGDYFPHWKANGKRYKAKK